MTPVTMLGGEETPSERAERHLQECEERVARLKAIIVEMERDNPPNATAMARALLPTMEEALRLFRRTAELMAAQAKGRIG